MKVFSLLLLIGLLLVNMPLCSADDPFNDQLMDVLSGRHDQCETWGYAAYTVKDTISILGIPVLPKGFRLKASTELGQDFLENNRIEMGIEF